MMKSFKRFMNNQKSKNKLNFLFIPFLILNPLFFLSYSSENNVKLMVENNVTSKNTFNKYQGQKVLLISDIENHWNQINTMSGKFKQKDPDGITSYGNFYFLKPYKSKFVYNDGRENIITNENLLIIVDDEGYKKAKQILTD